MPNSGYVLKRWMHTSERTSETASVLRTVRHAGEFGVQIGDPRLDLMKTMERKQAVIDQLISGVEGLLKNRKVTVYNGTGSLQSKTEVKVASVDGSEILYLLKISFLQVALSLERFPALRLTEIKS